MEDKKEQFFSRHMQDLADQACQGGYPVFSYFLTTKEYSILQGIKQIFRHVRLVCWGGHDDCEHIMAGFFPASWQGDVHSSFPISCIRISIHPGFREPFPEHRDYLGAVLNLGMERSRVGDIRVDGQTAYLFCCDEFSPLILQNLVTVKKAPVTCELLENGQSIPALRMTERTDSVSSPRLDSIVSALTGLSRTKATGLIRQGLVIADHREQHSVSYMCHHQSSITIRGYGKFRLDIPENSFTRKGKQKIIIYKYI